MSPIFNKSEAVEGGWAQVREAMLEFEGDVAATIFDTWGGTAIGDDGRPLPPKEYMEVKCYNIRALVVSEPLEMEVDGKEFNFRVNCSNANNSFWVEKLLASADDNGVILPDGLNGKRVRFKKEFMEWDIKGKKVSYSAFVIAQVLGNALAAPPTSQPVVQAPVVQQPVILAAPQVAPQPQVAQPVVVQAPVVAQTPPVPPPPIIPDEKDPMKVALELADGKTEAQYQQAIALHPVFVNSPFLALAKSGAIMQTLIGNGSIVKVQEEGGEVYRKVG